MAFSGDSSHKFVCTLSFSPISVTHVMVVLLGVGGRLEFPEVRTRVSAGSGISGI